MNLSILFRSWSESTSITLADIYSPAYPQNSLTTILYTLILCLSQQQYVLHNSELANFSSKALTCIVLNVQPTPTELDKEATELILSSIPEKGFLVMPFHHFSNDLSNDIFVDSMHSVCTLISTIACEFIDIVAMCSTLGCGELIELCLYIQKHPSQSICITSLEVWLMLQDIPLAYRHPDFGVPLFTKVLNTIVDRIKYPALFTNWDNEFEEDSQEFTELRSLVNDVLVSIYFLLRIKYIDRLCIIANSNIGKWNVMESVLYSFSAASKEICSQVQAKYNILTSKEDKDLTVERLLQVLQYCCSIDTEDNKQRRPISLSAICKYIGRFTPIWNDNCDSNALLTLILFLYQAISVNEAANTSCIAIKFILTGCSDKLISSILSSGEDLSSNKIMLSIVSITEGVLQMTNTDSAVVAIEGCARFCVRFKVPDYIRQALSLILRPVFEQIERALLSVNQCAPLSPVDQDRILNTISATLRMLREIFQFCSDIAEDETALRDVLNATWSLLRGIVNNSLCKENEEIMKRVSGVYCQLMKSLSKPLTSLMQELLTVMLGIFHCTSYPSTLDCVGIAAEVYGNGQEPGFGNVLSSVYNHVKEKEGKTSESEQFLQVSYT